MEWPPERRDISRIIDHISSPPQDTMFGKSFPDYFLDINWLSPVDIAVVPLLRPPTTLLIDWLIDWTNWLWASDGLQCIPVEDALWRPRLRSASTRCIQLPRVRTSTGQRRFAFDGPSIWNSLPSTLRDSSLSPRAFKGRSAKDVSLRSWTIMNTIRRCWDVLWSFRLTCLLTYDLAERSFIRYSQLSVLMGII